MQYTAKQIAAFLHGSIEGDPEALVDKLAKIEEADQLSLSFVANPKYEEYLYSSAASVLIVNETLQLNKPVTSTLIRVNDAYGSFALLLEKYNELFSPNGKHGREQPCFIAATAKVPDDTYIGAFTYIGENVSIGAGSKIYPNCFVGNNVLIGKNVLLHPGVKIYHDCTIGDNVVLHAGVVIGSDGFGFAPLADGTYRKIPQIGNVAIEDDVEIGANTTVDRATLGSTNIRKGVKLDNLVMIAHNVEIGENTVIAAQTGVSGSTRLGKHCVVGGQVGIVGHIHLADGTKINAQSGVSKSIIEPNTALNGTPAFDHRSSLKSQAVFKSLPEMQRKLIRLEEMIAELSGIADLQNVENKK